MFDLGDGLAVDASVMGNQTRRINHSAANPNVRALIVNDRGVRRVVMYAVGAVPKDAELFFDYGDRYWGALDEGRPVEAGDASADAAPSKRRRVSSGERDRTGWEARLANLVAYKVEHGDCNVPNHWADDPGLGWWVIKQRQYKKALDRGEPCYGMTTARAGRLDELGFAWELSAVAIGKGNRDDAGWEDSLAKLKAYKRKHGNCNVPRHWAEDPALGGWVDRQRKLKKRLDRGEPCEGMTAARAANLEALGFAWELSTGAQNTSHRTQADATAKAFEVDAVVDKRRYDKGV